MSDFFQRQICSRQELLSARTAGFGEIAAETLSHLITKKKAEIMRVKAAEAGNLSDAGCSVLELIEIFVDEA